MAKITFFLSIPRIKMWKNEQNHNFLCDFSISRAWNWSFLLNHRDSLNHRDRFLIFDAIYSKISRFQYIRLKTRFCYANDICIKAGLFRDKAWLLNNNAGVMENTLGVLKITFGVLGNAFTRVDRSLNACSKKSYCSAKKALTST